jgi:hypothetical protein
VSTPPFEVLVWANKIVSSRGAPPHELLGVPASASFETAQNAFHGIARTAHPDLHRRSLSPEDLETVTTAYALVAGAYQTIRTQPRPEPAPSQPSAGGRLRPGPTGAPATAAKGKAGASKQMSGRALIHYRKAELALKRGDLRGALLLVKMAIAADPQSPLLRSALAEIELEVKK